MHYNLYNDYPELGYLDQEWLSLTLNLGDIKK